MMQDQSTEYTVLRKMNPAASRRILEYLLRKLISRQLLQAPSTSANLSTSDSVPEKR